MDWLIRVLLKTSLTVLRRLLITRWMKLNGRLIDDCGLRKIDKVRLSQAASLIVFESAWFQVLPSQGIMQSGSIGIAPDR